MCIDDAAKQPHATGGKSAVAIGDDAAASDKRGIAIERQNDAAVAAKADNFAANRSVRGRKDLCG